MECALKYHFNAAERDAYHKSTHCQNVTNYSSMTRHFMMQGNTMQSTGYQPLRQYICLRTTQCEVPQPSVGQYHFTELSQVHYINNFQTHCYKHTLVTKDGTGT
jgi:hypothetical protein